MTFSLALSQIIVILIAGFVGEFIGVFIGGGGFFIQPAMLASNIPPHITVANDVSAALGATLVSAWVFHKKGKVDYKMLKPWIPGLTLGAIVGVFILSQTQSEFLKIFIIAVSVLGALYIAFKKETSEIKIKSISINPIIPSLVISFGFSAYIGFSGLGSGIIATLFLMLLYGRNIKEGMAFKEIIHVIPFAVAFIYYGLLGYLHWPILIPLILVNALAGYAGAHLAIALPEKFLKVIFLGGIMCFVAVLILNYIP